MTGVFKGEIRRETCIEEKQWEEIQGEDVTESKLTLITSHHANKSERWGADVRITTLFRNLSG